MNKLIQPTRGDFIAQISLRVPEDVREWLKNYAGLKGQSVNTAINAIVREKMEMEQNALS